MRDVAVACDCFRLPAGHMTSSDTQWPHDLQWHSVVEVGVYGALCKHLLHACSVNSPSLF
jgi:hypothetical protein